MTLRGRETVVQMWPRRLPVQRPRLGFLGLGGIGRARMAALAEADVAEVVAVADIDPGLLHECGAPRGASACSSLEALLRQPLDGVVIATPSGLHVNQAVAALERGCAVFCQQPMARTAAEATRAVLTARARGRLLGVDCSYRHVAGVAALREQVLAGELGDIYAIELVFHHASGPDQAWCYDVTQSGGGCVMDLGVHLVDLALWMTGRSRTEDMDAQLYCHGTRVAPPLQVPEDYASVQGRLEGGASVRMVCSWRLPAGANAVIEAAFYGTRGGAALRNVAGSLLDFTVDRFEGTRHWRLAAPPDAWGGRALVGWARRLARDPGFDDDARQAIDVAVVLDNIYAR